MKSARLLLSSLVAVVAALAFTACETRPLDPSGAYHSDSFLYQADVAITSSYDVLDGFVTWEYQNRALLAEHPEVTKAADRIRANAKQWFKSAHALRAAYVVDPSQVNRDKLSQVLAIIQAAILEASGYMAAPPAAPVTSPAS